MEHHREKEADASLGQVRSFDTHSVKLIKPLLCPCHLLIISDEDDFTREVRHCEERVIYLSLLFDLAFDANLARVDQLFDFFDVHEDEVLFLFCHVQCLHLQ